MLDHKKMAVNMKLSSARLFLMSSSQGMFYFQYSSQGNRKLLVATSTDHQKKMCMVQNDDEPGVLQMQKSAGGEGESHLGASGIG